MKHPNAALRFDAGKMPLDRIDPYFELALARLINYGGEKYGDPDNFRRGMPRVKCIASALRHINAIRRGEVTDPEAGIEHAVMAAWNMMALFHYQRVGIDPPDDRWSRKNASVSRSHASHPARGRRIRRSNRGRNVQPLRTATPR